MKRLPWTRLIGRRLIGPVLSLLALLVLLAILLANTAEAGLVVHGRVWTVHGQVAVRVGPSHVRPVRPHARHQAVLSKVDRKIARRLAHWTPYRKGVFFDLRKAGHSWREIGNILRISRRLMRAAVRPALHNYGYDYDWNHYLDRRAEVCYR